VFACANETHRSFPSREISQFVSEFQDFLSDVSLLKEDECSSVELCCGWDWELHPGTVGKMCLKSGIAEM
jgi:hypothetical protein